MRVLFLICATAIVSTATASASNLYSTSFEAPEFIEGPLGSQGGWAYSFGTDPTVTSAFSRTGDQSLVVSGTGTFGQNTITGPFSTAAPQISVQHSVFLDESADWSNTFVTFGLSGPDGFVGQLAIRNGSSAVLRPANEDLFSTPVGLGTWIDLELVLDFPSQTQEAFVNGVSIGTAAFANPAEEVSGGSIFFTNFDEQDITFYVDDVSITAVPEPGALALIAGAGMLALVARRRR